MHVGFVTFIIAIGVIVFVVVFVVVVCLGPDRISTDGVVCLIHLVFLFFLG